MQIKMNYYDNDLEAEALSYGVISSQRLSTTQPFPHPYFKRFILFKWQAIDMR